MVRCGAVHSPVKPPIKTGSYRWVAPGRQHIELNTCTKSCPGCVRALAFGVMMKRPLQSCTLPGVWVSGNGAAGPGRPHTLAPSGLGSGQLDSWGAAATLYMLTPGALHPHREAGTWGGRGTHCARESAMELRAGVWALPRSSLGLVMVGEEEGALLMPREAPSWGRLPPGCRCRRLSPEEEGLVASRVQAGR